MRKTCLAFLAALLILSSMPALAWLNRRPLIEHVLNHSLRDFFKGSVRLAEAEFTSGLRLSLKGLNGNFHAESGPIPLQVRKIESLDSLAGLVLGRPVRFVIEGLRPLVSAHEGVRGEAVYQAGRNWRFEMKADILGLGLQDHIALSPENLSDSNGTLKGSFHLVTDARADPVFGLTLLAPEPGGRVHARFFDMLLPYLPQVSVREKVREISGATRLVSYRDANFHMSLETPESMKLFLHILVPEYNMDLNINMQIHVDKENSFFQIAQMLGLIQIES